MVCHSPGSCQGPEPARPKAPEGKAPSRQSVSPLHPGACAKLRKNYKISYSEYTSVSSPKITFCLQSEENPEASWNSWFAGSCVSLSLSPSLSLHHMRTQGEVGHLQRGRGPSPAHPCDTRSQTSSLQNRGMNVCCLSHPSIGFHMAARAGWDSVR